jgi:hypothetical protein
MKQEGSRPACIRYPAAYCGLVNEYFKKVMKLMNIGEILKLLFLMKKRVDGKGGKMKPSTQYRN